MFFTLFRQLWLAIALILLATASLLLSDLDKRLPADQNWSLNSNQSLATTQHHDGPVPDKHYTIALSYFVPAVTFEQAIQGIKDGLAARGYVEGENLTFISQHCNADLGMLSQVTQSLTNKNPNIFMALSTPCLANALTVITETPLVFAIVSSPIEAKAGVSYSDHRANVTGAVFENPTAEMFKFARQLFPEARRIGTIYNPAEANSVACLDRLKIFFEEFNFELVSVPVMSSNEVLQSAQSIVSQGIDLFYAMGDNTVANNLPSILKNCRDHDIPVIANDGSLMGSGALYSYGPSPYAEGQHAAELAARIFAGEDPAAIPFEPSRDYALHVDFNAAKRLNVTLPTALKQQLDYTYNLAVQRGRPAKIAIVNLVSNTVINAAIEGLDLGLQQHGLITEKDYTIQQFCAQGDMGLLPQLFDAAIQSNPDVIVSITTPAFIAGLHKVKELPLVFSVASDPTILGLFNDGKPRNVTGVHDNPAIDRLVQMAQDYDPEIDTLGIIYDPSQPQSQITVDRLQRAGQRHHLKILMATASTASDLPMATQAIIQRGAKALIVSTDNLANTGFGAIHKVAAAQQIPIFVTDMELINEGAIGGIGDNYKDWGKQSATQIMKILSGLSPQEIPIEATPNLTCVVPRAKKQ
jgi:ABC-type uncharacterized transport system substrate-binding protein